MRDMYTEFSPLPNVWLSTGSKEIKKLSFFATDYLLLYDGKQEDGREYNDGSGPKTGCHLVQVAKKKKGHNDAVYRLKVGDERHPKG